MTPKLQLLLERREIYKRIAASVDAAIAKLNRDILAELDVMQVPPSDGMLRPGLDWETR